MTSNRKSVELLKNARLQTISPQSLFDLRNKSLTSSVSENSTGWLASWMRNSDEIPFRFKISDMIKISRKIFRHKFPSGNVSRNSREIPNLSPFGAPLPICSFVYLPSHNRQHYPSTSAIMKIICWNFFRCLSRPRLVTLLLYTRVLSRDNNNDVLLFCSFISVSGKFLYKFFMLFWKSSFHIFASPLFVLWFHFDDNQK